LIGDKDVYHLTATVATDTSEDGQMSQEQFNDQDLEKFDKEIN
jgi:hypothetical protein